MQKYLITGILALLLISSIAGAISQDISYKEGNNESTAFDMVTADFTHTVFAEDASTTWCQYCDNASRTLYSVYNSSEYPFYYVTLISDKNPIAQQRMKKLNVYSIPIIYFDGGFITNTGAVNESVYQASIEESGLRTVKQPLETNTNVTWDGDAKITVTVTVKNDGNFFYLGILRSYVTEIVSRWIDDDGDPFHFGFLDFAINKIFFVRPGKTYTATATFDGTEVHGNQTFEDITQDNIMVVSTVSHWLPHIGKTDSNRLFLAFYVDQTSAAIPI